MIIPAFLFFFLLSGNRLVQAQDADSTLARPVPRDKADLEETERKKKEAEEEARKQAQREYYEKITGRPHPGSPDYYDRMMEESRKPSSTTRSSSSSDDSDDSSDESPPNNDAPSPRPPREPSPIATPRTAPSMEPEPSVNDYSSFQDKWKESIERQQRFEESWRRSAEMIKRIEEQKAIYDRIRAQAKEKHRRTKKTTPPQEPPAPTLESMPRDSHMSLEEAMQVYDRVMASYERSQSKKLEDPVEFREARERVLTSKKRPIIDPYRPWRVVIQKIENTVEGYYEEALLGMKKDPTTPIAPASAERMRELTISAAQGLTGQPYAWRGPSPSKSFKGLDCSGFAYQVLFGDDSNNQRTNAQGYFVKAKENLAIYDHYDLPRSGDIFFKENYRNNMGHIGFIESCQKTGSQSMSCFILHADGGPKYYVPDGSGGVNLLSTQEEINQYKKEHNQTGIPDAWAIDGSCAPGGRRSCAIQRTEWKFQLGQNGRWIRENQRYYFADSLRMRGVRENR